MNVDAWIAILYGLFVGGGYAASGFFHVATWPKSKGLATWGSFLRVGKTRQVSAARNWMLLVAAVLAIAWTTLFFLSLDAQAVLWIGTGLVLFGVVASQWVASSAVKVVYEGSFPALALFSALFFEHALPGSDIQPVPTLLAALALSVAYVGLVLNFVNQIFSRADWTGATKGRQIRRHIFLMAYLAVGMAFGLIVPLIGSALP